MRTLTKNAATEITAARVQVGSVIRAPHALDDGTMQTTWAVDQVEADGDMVRFHVSSPRSGKHGHSVLFGADGNVVVSGAVSAPKPTAAAKPASAPKGTETRKPAKRTPALTSALAAVAKLPAVAKPEPTTVVSPAVNSFADRLAAKLTDKLGAHLDALVESALDSALDAAIARVLA